MQTKTRKDIHIRIPTEYKERLMRLADKKLSEGQSLCGVVYLNTEGNAVTYTRMDSAIRSVLMDCGIKKKSPLHAFRHTVAMRLLAAMPVNVVANQLGDTVETVVRNYIKPILPEQSQIDLAYDAGSGKGQEVLSDMTVLMGAQSRTDLPLNPQKPQKTKGLISRNQEAPSFV